MILAALLGVGCSVGKEDDTAYTTSTTDGAAVPVVDGVSVDCSDGSTCFWTVTVGGAHATAADLYLTDLTAQPDTAWSEHHYDFVDVTGAGEAQTLLLSLHIGETPADYLPNFVTLYDIASVDAEPGLGVAVMVKDATGAVTDCWLVHYEPSAFYGTCP